MPPGAWAPLALLIAAAGGSSASETCDRCPRPLVVVYDLMLPERAVFPGDSPAFDDLFDANRTLRAILSLDQLDRRCVAAIDGNIHSRDPTLRALDQIVPPPTGPLGGWDYLVTGRVLGTPLQGLEITAELQHAPTRAMAAQSSSTIDKSHLAPVAAESAFKSLLPLYAKVREHQKKLRAAQGVAIEPRLEITPEKTRLAVRASTPVTLSIGDCDDQTGPFLQDRVIELSSESGRFDPPRVKTDASGRARSRFTALKKGLAVLDARAEIKDVRGREVPVHGRAGIVVDVPALRHFRIDALLRGHITTSRTVKERAEQVQIAYRVHVQEIAASLPIEGGAIEIEEDAVVSSAVTGELIEHSSFSQQELDQGELRFASYEQEHSTGRPITRNVSRFAIKGVGADTFFELLPVRFDGTKKTQSRRYQLGRWKDEYAGGKTSSTRGGLTCTAHDRGVRFDETKTGWAIQCEQTRDDGDGREEKVVLTATVDRLD